MSDQNIHTSDTPIYSETVAAAEQDNADEAADEEIAEDGTEDATEEAKADEAE
jgi:hypothetical protein